MSVAVAHLTPAHFTQQVARAFHEQGVLEAFFCPLVDQPAAPWQRLVAGMAGLAGRDLHREFGRRAITEIPVDRVHVHPWRELVRMAEAKLLHRPVLGDRLFHWTRDGFERWVSRQLLRPRFAGLRWLYGYEYGSLAMFRAARRMGIGTIYDLPSPEHDAVEALLAPEFERFPALVTPYRRHTLALQEQRTQRRRAEWEAADLVIANSSFTARTWQRSDWPPRRVEVVPLGAPPPAPDPGEAMAGGPLRLLWAGTFSIRKGAHLLLDALRRLGLGPERLVVEVYGAVTLPSALLQSLPDALVLCGSIPRSELLARMRVAHALLFPTLCDGFGLVVNEAFSQGLPVVTTRRAGAADLVRDGVNGWLIEAGSADAIADWIRQALLDPASLQGFRPAAWSTAAEWQWSDYRQRLAEVIPV